MKNRKPEDDVLAMCASLTVLLGAAAFTALLYKLITVAVPLVELAMSHSQRMLLTTGF
jgi:hypothetical protein